MEDIKTIKMQDEEYPKLLKKIANPPKILYIKGDLNFNKMPCFAIVGSRRCSDYGKRAVLNISNDLTNAGFIIVSGLAKGIDTLAHTACLNQSGRTIAVLGTGIDEKSIFPQENLKLAKQIIETGGTIISEFPPGTPGYKGNFPLRNRIISGLCLGTLIIEAKYNSGALITARRAIDEKRKIFAIPGSIYSLNSQGPNDLIRKGAKLVMQANDIIKELKLPQLKFDFKQEIKGKNKEQNLILDCLKEKELNIDKIIEKTKLPADIIASEITMLEMEDKIKDLGGDVYIINNQ